MSDFRLPAYVHLTRLLFNFTQAIEYIQLAFIFPRNLYCSALFNLSSYYYYLLRLTYAHCDFLKIQSIIKLKNYFTLCFEVYLLNDINHFLDFKMVQMFSMFEIKDYFCYKLQ